MNSKLAIALHDLSPSQLNYLAINQGSKYILNNPDKDFVIFYENLTQSCFPINFATMNLVEGWSFDGTVIATNLQIANSISRFPASFRKIFYIWDLEWLRFHGNYREFHSIYSNPNLKLFCRSLDHKIAIENAWNVKCDISENFDLEKILS